MPKRTIRAEFLSQRKSLSGRLWNQWSLDIQTRFLKSDVYRDADTLALYCSFNNEVRTDKVAQSALTDGKQVVYPKVVEGGLRFFEISSLCQLKPGAFGIKEPLDCPEVQLFRLEAIVVPGVVFDINGHRLGYGRGYYDRALDKAPPTITTVGFAFDFQIIDTLPAIESHDRPLAMVMTELRTIVFAEMLAGFGPVGKTLH
jgi:5-formyltetrahydrofolate cyclo-ligase